MIQSNNTHASSALMLLSGGLDSVTALAWALEQGYTIEYAISGGHARGNGGPGGADRSIFRALPRSSCAAMPPRSTLSRTRAARCGRWWSSDGQTTADPDLLGPQAR